MIRDHAITQIAADPYSGKTMLMLYMALCVDFHMPLFERFPLLRTDHRVLYIGPDSPDWDMAQQSRKLLCGMGVPQDSWKLTTIQMHLEQDTDITNPEFIESVNEFHVEHGFTILFIDTLLDVHPFNPNDAQQMKKVMAVLKLIRDQLHCAVIFAHHTSKPMGFARPDIYAGAGSFKISGSSDFQVVLRRKGVRCHLSWGKQRGQQNESPIDYYDMEDVERDGVWGIKMVPPTGDDRDALVLARIGQGCNNRRELAKLLIVDLLPSGEKLDDTQALKAVDNAIQSLRIAGKIKSVERGRWTIT